MKYFVLVTLPLLFLFVAATPLVAQAPCTPVYGGGVKEDGNPYCVEDLQTNAAPTPAGFQTPNDSMVQGATTKGGTPLKPAPTVTNQPNTGPEMLGLFALIPAAWTGWKLRKNASK